MSKIISLAFTNATNERHEEYNKWYDEQHIIDALMIPGIKWGERYRLSTKSRNTSPYQYLAIYEIDDILKMQQEVAARAATPLMPRSELMDADRIFLEYEMVTPRITAEEAAAIRGVKPELKSDISTSKIISLAFTNATNERHEEYNKWYDEQHIIDALMIPGIKWGERYRLSTKSRNTSPYQYLAIYEIDDILKMQQEVAARAATPLMPRSELMDADRIFLEYEMVTPRITAEEAAAIRSIKR